MVSIDEVIRQEINPFDLINIKPGNFWGEQQDKNQRIASIHQEAVEEVEAMLNLVATDHRSRSILLVGDSGSGKSYLLGRLKQTFNDKAFFAYIGPWVDSEYIWRHTLRYTVDSLMQIPEGQQDSQLLLWLKSLSAFTKRSLKQRVLDDDFWGLLQSDRQKFIKHLKQTYRQSGIYNSDSFFGVLHDLTNPELYPLACEWLRGDEISEESMQILKVKHCIDSEEAAKNVLANFGRIANQTYPIVLCFDNLDNIPKLPDGKQDFQALFNVNTTIHNDLLKNFLVVISIVTDTWKRNCNGIKQADRARLERAITLKYINLDQAEALWHYRLNSVHQKANPKPDNVLFPLNRQLLEQNFKGGKTTPRHTIVLGQKEYQKYKLNPDPGTSKKPGNFKEPDLPDKVLAEFKLFWQREYQKVQTKITKLSLVPGTELISMMQEVLEALEVSAVKPKLLTGKYASYSLKCQHPQSQKTVGVIWVEDSNMNTFYSVMSACQKAISNNLCNNLYLVRAVSIGRPNLAGHQIYRQIFTGKPHCHIKPSLGSAQLLATYHNLVNAALAKDLVIAGKVINLKELQDLTRRSGVLQSCRLLQDLNIIVKSEVIEPDPNPNLRIVRDYLMNIVITQQFLGRKVLIQNTSNQFPEVEHSQIEHLINQLRQENKISIANPKAKPEAQTVCLVV